MLPAIYKPKHEVECYDWNIYTIDSENFNLFKKKLEEAKFINIWETLLAVSSIKSVKPAKQEISILETLIWNETEDIKEKVRKKVREREKEWLSINEWVINNIILSYK